MITLILLFPHLLSAAVCLVVITQTKAKVALMAGFLLLAFNELLTGILSFIIQATETGLGLAEVVVDVVELTAFIIVLAGIIMAVPKKPTEG